MVLFANNADITVIEGPGYTERAAQSNNYWVAAASTTRQIVRLSLEVSPSYLSGGSKPWTYIQPLSNTAISPAFKSN
ncbi:glucose-6-phosphate dehydrogenase [Nostoc sp.]|uniref:glucose-6-phosphate dehydrogenase n=1 Tax=Nostoc sp. TaxID=1180 RepID=UPI002FF5C7CA